jgi:hypothetical protein
MGYEYQKQTGKRNYMFHKPIKIINKTYKYGGTNLSLEVLNRFVSTLWKMSQLLKRRKVVYSKQIGRPVSYCTKNTSVVACDFECVYNSNFPPLSPQTFCLIVLSLHLT